MTDTYAKYAKDGRAYIIGINGKINDFSMRILGPRTNGLFDGSQQFEVLQSPDEVDAVKMARALFTLGSYPFPKLASGACLRRTLVDITGGESSAATKPYILIVLDQGLPPEFDIKACDRLAVSKDWEMCHLEEASRGRYSGVDKETKHYSAWVKVPPRF